MILGCIADDFTGAADLASILVSERMRTSLLTSVDDVPGADGDAVVVALKTRSVSPDAAIRQSLAAMEALRAGGCEQIFFKYCSTFDSTRKGNIGPVAEALAASLGAQAVVVCPAFPSNGRTVYKGNLFVGDVPLAESGMRSHPLTPMTDSDIRRWLAHQVSGPVGHIAHEIVRRGRAAVRDALSIRKGLVVVDAIEDADLRAIGGAVADAPLVTGGSALAMELPQNFRARGRIDPVEIPRFGQKGPAILLAGSCSDATNKQVETYARDHPSMAIDIDRLLAGDPVLEEADLFGEKHLHDAPLLYSTAPAAQSQRFIGADGINRAAAAIEGLMSELALRAVARGVVRIVVAGGETSGAVVEALRLGPLRVGHSVAPGVPVLGAERLVLALKSGNFGDELFFQKALAALEEK